MIQYFVWGPGYERPPIRLVRHVYLVILMEHHPTHRLSVDAKVAHFRPEVLLLDAACRTGGDSHNEGPQ